MVHKNSPYYTLTTLLFFHKHLSKVLGTHSSLSTCYPPIITHTSLFILSLVGHTCIHFFYSIFYLQLTLLHLFLLSFSLDTLTHSLYFLLSSWPLYTSFWPTLLAITHTHKKNLFLNTKNHKMEKNGFYFHLIVMILEMWGHVTTLLHEFPSSRGFISTQLQHAGVFFLYNALPYYSNVSFLPHVDFFQCNCNIELQWDFLPPHCHTTLQQCGFLSLHGFPSTEHHAMLQQCVRCTSLLLLTTTQRHIATTHTRVVDLVMA